MRGNSHDNNNFDVLIFDNNRNNFDGNGNAMM